MTNSAHFPTNDWKRRRLQTGLTVATLTLSVASTLFLLLFSNRLGVGVAVQTTGMLTLGLTNIFGQFILFIGVLIFAVGAILTSFIISLMMAQRTRDFGLIKAAGCPNSLVAGYFMTELLSTTLLGCVLGVSVGFLADFAVSNLMFSTYTLPIIWFVPLVFVVFFVLAVFFGIQPLLKAARMSPLEALSPVTYYGALAEKRHAPLSRRAITWRLASRSLGRRQSVGLRVVFLLSVVFVLLTVSVGGGIIASGTTMGWVEEATGSHTIAIAHSDVAAQYKMFLSKFSNAQEISNFDFADAKLAVPTAVRERVNALSSVSSVDSRLVLYEQIREMANFTIIDGKEMLVGDSREGMSLVIGVDLENFERCLSLKGVSLSGNDTSEALIGDSLSQTMYYPDPQKGINLADPLVESLAFQNRTFRIVGVGIDPINNGLVTYLPLKTMMNVTGLSEPNLLLVKLDQSVDRNTALIEIQNAVTAMDPKLTVFDLHEVTEQNLTFLSSTWQTIMLLPFLTVASAALCLVGYMMLVVDEQRQEFGMLRAVGAKPRIVLSISAIQSAVLLIGSCAVGLSLGIMGTLIILMPNPIVTATTILLIGGWLAAALTIMFVLSLIPAYRQTKTSILKTLS
jgi:ABC-type antimicrobial peptide transport system permease subunit